MIYLLRHGQTEFNRAGRYQGQQDSPLTELGMEQARDMGRRLKALIGDPAGWVLTASPLGRAHHTAELVRAEIGAAGIVPEPRIAEVDIGAWGGLTHDDIDGQYPGMLDGATRYDWTFRAPGGEGGDAFFARLRAWLAHVEADGRPHVAVSHGIAGRGLCALYTEQSMESVRTGGTPQDSIFRLHQGRIENV